MRQITKNHYGKGYPMKWWGLSVLGILLLGFTTACEDQENDPRDPVTQQDMDFAVDATYSNLSEIEFGQLAVEKAEYESVRDFGVLMVTDHTNAQNQLATIDRKSTRLNSSHVKISYAVFCLKKKKKHKKYYA